MAPSPQLCGCDHTPSLPTAQLAGPRHPVDTPAVATLPVVLPVGHRAWGRARLVTGSHCGAGQRPSAADGHLCSPLLGKLHGFLHIGDLVIVVTGWRPGSGYTNIMRVLSVS